MNKYSHAGGLQAICSYLTAGLIASACVITIQPCAGALVNVGDVAPNFTVTDHKTGQPVHLYDYPGTVIVLDFWAYWCGPCQASSPDLRANVDDYYATRHGNAHGVPVVVMSINIESQDPAATDAFISAFKLHLVCDDFSGQAYNEFGNGFIPTFAIINAVNPERSHKQWEVLYRDSGYPGAAALRTIIDSIDPSILTGPATIRTGPTSQVMRVSENLTYEVAANGATPISYQWLKNDLPIPGATSNKLAFTPLTLDQRGFYKIKVSNGLGSQTSPAARLMVYEKGTTNLVASTNGPQPIPDYPNPGITSVINVQDDWEVSKLGVRVSIPHAYVGDLFVSLTAPSGTSYTLREPTGTAGNQLSINLPDVRIFMGERARGAWSLKVADRASPNVGIFSTWSLSIEHPPDRLNYQEWAAEYPGANLTDPAADSDGDGVPNFIEYLLNDGSPQVANQLPKLEADPSDPQYLQLTVPLRPNTERAILSVQLAPSLNNNAWTEAVTSGDNVIVDQSVPNTLKVRLKRSANSMFVRLVGIKL